MQSYNPFRGLHLKKEGESTEYISKKLCFILFTFTFFLQTGVVYRFT